MQKKRLILFQPFIGPYRIDFTNDLNQAFEAKVCLKLPHCEGQAFEEKDILGQLNYVPHYLPTGSMRQLFKELRKVIISFKPDIVVTFEFDIITAFVLIWRWMTRGHFKIVGMSDDSYDMLIGHGFTWKHTIGRKLLAKHLDDIILVEPDAVDWYRKKYHIGYFFPIIRDEKIVSKMYEAAVPLLQRTMEQYHLSGKYIYLYVGRLASTKNIPVLIDAFSGLDPSKNQLVIVGDGPEADNLRKKAEELGINILFTGQLRGPALYAWYLLAHSFILPSIKEPFGAVTNEALIGGCCAVISQKAGSRCLVDEGINGYIFDPYSVEDLRKKMILSKELYCSSTKLPRGSKMIYHYDDMFESLCKMLYSI